MKILINYKEANITPAQAHKAIAEFAKKNPNLTILITEK